MEYDILRPWETLDDWQKKYIESWGDCILVAGRQVGKTTAMSIKIGERALLPNRTIFIGALTEKQAYNLYFKALMYLQARYPGRVKQGKDKPTQHEFTVRNKDGDSVVMCYALGQFGMGIRTYTITDLFVDECREISREAFVSLEPMLSVTKGTKDYASTPGGKQGYFYEMSKEEHGFNKFHVNAEDCPRHSPEFLAKQRKALSRIEYAQEYLGQFLDEVLRVYPEALLKEVLKLKRRLQATVGKFFGGVDVARLGQNKSALSVGEAIRNDYAEQVELVTTEKKYTTETVDEILRLQNIWNCRMWGIDGSGVGGGVIDQCFRTPQLRYKVEDLNNATRPIDADGERKEGLLKEQMYINLLRMMEKGEIKLLDDIEQEHSLANAFYEYDDKGNMKIFGADNDIREAVIRMAWEIAQSKGLKLFATHSNSKKIWYG